MLKNSTNSSINKFKNLKKKSNVIQMDRNCDNGLFGTKRVINQGSDVITILVYRPVAQPEFFSRGERVHTC